MGVSETLVEFLPYNEALQSLTEQGVGEQVCGDLVRFELSAIEHSENPVGQVQRVLIGADCDGANDAIRCVTLAKDQLGRAVEELVHSAHMAMPIMIPVGQWRDVFELVAFELAGDEIWDEVDAEAALHQHSRDPLGLHQKQRHVLSKIVDALLATASEEKHDLTIAALDTPVVIEVLHTGQIRLSCIGQETAESLIDSLSAVR